jgi:hypothetical protein
MLYFFGALALLILGFFTYGKFVDVMFQPDSNRCTRPPPWPTGWTMCRSSPGRSSWCSS